ncbi:MCE family protein [Spirillospora sp. NPDC048911]|uniref:MCE family protein n=1 Tax=Spirillospora sp. NPDC048911 TaxID=3364527 RepID=UPI00370FCBCC
MRRPYIRLGAAALAGMTALSGCSFRGVDSIPLPGGPDVGDNPLTVKVEFANVLDLVPQSVVKVNDVSVGKVEKIELAGRTTGAVGQAGGGGWRAVVTVKVRRDTRLPDNAVATIGQTSLLGEKFVALSSPANEAPQGQLGNNDLIPLDRTTRSAEIEEVLSAMSLLLNGGGLEQVSTITRELNAAMGGREATIKSALHRVDTFVGTLDRNRSSIVRAIDSIDRLTGKLSAERATINDTIDKAGPAVGILNRNRADLTKMLVSLDKLSRRTTGVIRASQEDLLANLRDVDKVLRNLNKSGDTLPKTLEALVAFPFAPSFNDVIKGDYGNIRLTVDLDMESLARNLLGGTDLEGLLNSGKGMRSLLKVPNLTLPQSPLGVLPNMPGDTSGGGLPGLPGLNGGQNGQNGGQNGGKTGGQTGGNTNGKPRSMGRSDLEALMTGGLS